MICLLKLQGMISIDVLTPSQRKKIMYKVLVIQYNLLQQYKATGQNYRSNCTYVRVTNI